MLKGQTVGKTYTFGSPRLVRASWASSTQVRFELEQDRYWGSGNYICNNAGTRVPLQRQRYQDPDLLLHDCQRTAEGLLAEG